MVVPTQKVLGDYWRRIDVGQISLGFQSANLVTHDIKNSLLSGLKEISFNGQEIKIP